MCDRFSFLKKIGSVILAYFTGIVVGSAGIFGDGIEVIQDVIMNVSVSVAIPLMLFSTDIRKVKKLASGTLLSLIIVLFVVVFVVFVGYLLFRVPGNEEFAKVGGLLVGVYTGGTPNLAALQLALKIKPEIFLAVHAYDMVITTIYLFILMTFGKRLFSLVLPEYKFKGEEPGKEIADDEDTGEQLRGLFNRNRMMPLLKALFLAIGIFGIAAGIMLLVSESLKMIVYIMVLTTLSIIASFNVKVRRTEKTFDLGMYFILIFSIVIASKINPGSFTNINTNIFFYISFVVIGGLFLQVLISSFFKIDTDTVMITSTALICSPPFVPVIAGAIGNREIVLPGITVGLIGYAVGNYLGLITAMLLSAI